MDPRYRKRSISTWYFENRRQSIIHAQTTYLADIQILCDSFLMFQIRISKYNCLFISIHFYWSTQTPTPLTPHVCRTHSTRRHVLSRPGRFVFSASWDQGRFGFVSKWGWFGGIPDPLTMEFVKVFFGGPGHENEGKITISLASWVDYTPKIYIYIIIQGSLYYQPKQCIVLRENPQKYHRFVLFDSPMSDGW